MDRRRIGGIVGIGIGVVGLAFVGVQIVRERDAFADAVGSASLPWLAAAVGLGLVAMTGIGLNWTGILRHHGVTVPLRRGLAWYFVGQLGKYVPGGIWPIVGQAEMATRGGARRSAAYPSTGWSMAAQLLGAAVVAAVAGALSGRIVAPALLVSGVAAVLLVASWARVRSAAERVFDRFLPGRVLVLPRGSWLTAQVVWLVPAWIAYSAMNVAVVVALGTDMTWDLAAEVAFATCASWMAGFVIIGLPGGIGVREALFVSVTTASLGAGLAASIAVTSRLVTIVVDLAGAAVATLAARPGSSPEPPPEARAAPGATSTEPRHPGPVDP